MSYINKYRYVKLFSYFYFLLQKMVRTKVTPRNKQDWSCHFRNTVCKTEAVSDVHTLKCAKVKKKRKGSDAQSLGVIMLRPKK